MFAYGSLIWKPEFPVLETRSPVAHGWHRTFSMKIESYRGTPEQPGYMMCLDLCGVDYLAHPGRTLPEGVHPERFEVVITLISHLEGSRLRLRVQVPEADPVVPSLFPVHPGSDAMERETFDMFGITFDGHPDLTRILMPEDWIGHPLRKDYDSGRIPVQFKGAPR